MSIAKFSPLFLVLFLTGCASSTITNLTPSQLPRNQTGLYLFEMAFDTSEQAIRKESITPYVIIGPEMFPMQTAPVLRNRWETLIPIPPDQDVVHYRYKVDYQSRSIPVPRPGSKLSPPQRLEIVDR